MGGTPAWSRHRPGGLLGRSPLDCARGPGAVRGLVPGNGWTLDRNVRIGVRGFPLGMKILRLIPVVVGVAILLLGVYLVSSHGYLDGTYLPSLIGIQPCNSAPSSSLPNGTGCTGFSPYGGYGVGTIVCIFGLGLIGSSLRRAVVAPSAGAATLSPEVLAALTQAQGRMQAVPGSSAPGPKQGTVYCSKCGAANPAEAKFCHQCASSMPGTVPTMQPAMPPAVPPGR